MNAVLLKELRQSVRNRYVLAAYMIFVVALLVVAGVQISGFVKEGASFPLSLFGSGRTLFLTVHTIFAGFAIVFIPSYVAYRIVRERWGANPDLMYVTPMSPSRLLMGKFISAMTLAGLFLGAALPLLALSYFIGGIDVLSIVMSVLLTLGLSAVLTLYAMLLASVPVPKIIRGLLLLGGAASLVLIVKEIWIEATEESCSAGFMNILGNRESCITFAVAMAGAVSVAGLLYTAALAAFRPATVERMRPFRALATALFAAWGIAAFIHTKYYPFADTLEPWVTLLMGFAAFMMMFALSERPEPGIYQRKQMPRSLVWRIVGYPFRTGQRNAVLWTVLLLLIGVVLSHFIFSKEGWCDLCGKRHSFLCEGTTEGESILIFILTVSGYVLTVLLVWYYALRRKMSNAPLWWIAALVVAGIAILLASLREAGIESIVAWPGYLFADRWIVLFYLYGWNALAISLLAPIYLRARFAG